MLELFAAAAFLLATHFGISSTGIRSWLVARLGERPYLALYSLVALAALVWVASAYARAPYIELWPMTAWSAWVPLVVMPFALLLAVCGVSTLNPTAVGAPAHLDPAEPARGILRITRHPFMWGVALWAFAHLVPNGDLAAIVLFGLFAVLALAGTRAIDRKQAARRGTDWQRYVAVTSNVPFAAILAGRQTLVLREIGWARVAATILLYVLLLAVHPWLFGVSPRGVA